MTITDTLVKQKTHIIYGVVILVLCSVGYHFFSKTPSEIIKTKVETKIETKIVNKDVVRTKTVFVDKVKETKKANGDVIVETSHIRSSDDTKDKSTIKDDLKSTVTTTEVIKFMKRYSIDVMYPMSISNIAAFKPLDIQVMVGVRIFSLPVFATIGTDGHFDKIIVGARMEF